MLDVETIVLGDGERMHCIDLHVFMFSDFLFTLHTYAYVKYTVLLCSPTSFKICDDRVMSNESLSI